MNHECRTVAASVILLTMRRDVSVRCGRLCAREASICPALQRAFDSGKPACVNVVIKQDMNYKGGSYI